MLFQRQSSTARSTGRVASWGAVALVLGAWMLHWCGETTGQEHLAPIVPASAMPRPGLKRADVSQSISRRRQTTGPLAFENRQLPVLRIELGRSQPVLPNFAAPIASAFAANQSVDSSPLASFDSQLQILTPTPLPAATTAQDPVRAVLPPAAPATTIVKGNNSQGTPRPQFGQNGATSMEIQTATAVSLPMAKSDFLKMDTVTIASALDSFDAEKRLITS